MTPTGWRARTSLAALTAAALTFGAVAGAVGASAVGADTALLANDLTVGDYAAVTDTGTDFTIYATADKKVSVDATDRVSDRGDHFTRRIKLNGAGTADARSLHFSVGADQVPTQVVVDARSSSTSDRALALYDATGEVARVDAPGDDETTPVETATFDVTTAGDYYLASPSSGVNVFYAQLGPVETGDRAAWADVAAPTVAAVELDADDPAKLLVHYTGLLGQDGGDVVAATLYDTDGAVVDQALAVEDGDGGTIALTPPSSGSYQVEVRATRYGESAAHTSDRVGYADFSLPLAGPEVTSALTTAVAGGKGTVTVTWSAVAEAETYAVQVSTDGADWTTAVDGVTGTSAAVPDLAAGTTYQLRVVAHRGDDQAPGAVFEATVATAVERWKTADIGSNAGSGGSVTQNGDGTITFDARASSTKLASSEDGFQYYYTQIDPSTENFTLTATFRVDDASAKDNQSGFGVVAVDSLVPGSSADRYFNSAGALVTRYGEGTATVSDGAPGARFVHGYTGATDDNTAGARDTSGSALFDPTWRSDVTGPKFQDGDEYTLTLRRSNTGYHAIWHRDGKDLEVIDYDPAMLQQQDPDHLYVGLAVARKIEVTVTDWDFTTIRPEDDDPAQEPPTTYVPAHLSVDVTRTTPASSLDIPLVADMYGTGQILDADGKVVVDGLALEPGTRVLAPVDLARGENRFTARLLPDAEQPQLGEHEEIESTDPVDVPLTITVDSYGRPGQSIRVAPDGTSDGAGTQASPLDLDTAVAYAQPGQQIVLADGAYRLQHKVVADRGHDGTKDAPITLMSAPGGRAVLDLSESSDGGLDLRADWWHVYDLEITGSHDVAKPMLIEGNHNVVERVESHHNKDTGIQISGSSNEPPSMWPSDNLVVSSVSHDNADTNGNDADGFAAKLTVGEGNVFRDDISHHNIDDGWDLYAKSTTGPIGTVVIENSVAYDNGRLSDDPTRTGEGNGFKLGGESMPGNHLLRNALSYGNRGTGVTSNSGPDIRVHDVTTVDNETSGVRLETNAKTTGYEASGVLSWGSASADVLGLEQDDTSLLTDPSNYFDGATADASDGRPAKVTADWFVSTDAAGLRPTIAADGSVDTHGLYELTAAAPSDTGARLAPIDDPTVIEVLPEVTVPLANTAAPTITGTAKEGKVLQAHPGTWTVDATYTYRWLRDGKPVGKKGEGASYRVTGSDSGHTLSVEVTAHAHGQDPVAATSAGVAVPSHGNGPGNGPGTICDVVTWIVGWITGLLRG